MKKISIKLTLIAYLTVAASLLMFGVNIKSNPGAAWAWLFSAMVNAGHLVAYNKIANYLNENK